MAAQNPNARQGAQLSSGSDRETVPSDRWQRLWRGLKGLREALRSGMRIISGTAGGVHLDVPKSGTRPTQDKVRQAVFSMLGDLVVGARVLDLFAGSGALGLECLSRGAVSALFVESDRGAAQVIHRNLEKSRLAGGSVRQADALKVLVQLQESGARYDLVLADPPYAHREGDEQHGAKLLRSAALLAILPPEGSLVLEVRGGGREVDSALTELAASWNLERDRAYGDTRILWLRRRSESAPPGA